MPKVTGVFQRRPGGLWYFHWQHKVYTHGKQIQRGGHYKTAAEATKARNDYIRKVSSRSPFYEQYEKWTTADLCRWFITDHDEVNNRRTTVMKTKSMCKCHIVPAVGSINIFELTNQDIMRFKKDYVHHETEATAYNALQILKRILSRAVKEDILQYSPFKVGLPPKPHAEYPTVDPEKLRDMLLDLRGIDRAIISTAGMQGRRNGEIGGLQWGDLDFEAMEMHIRRQFVKSEIVYHLKSRKGKNELVIPMTISYVKMIKEWKLECPPGEWVFPGIFPHLPMSIDAWRKRHWGAIRERYGLPDRLRLHDLRHSFATILLAAGVSLSVVQELLGHASIRITKDTYGHLETRHLRKDMEIFEKLFDMPREAKKPWGGNI